MPEERMAVAVIVSAGGALLDEHVLRRMPGCRVLAADVAAAGRSACATALIGHRCDVSTVRAACRSWGAGRGWRVTVAPLQTGH